MPPDAPLRYPGPEIDDALLKLFDPKQADDTINFTLPKACRALARRGRTALFDRIALQLEAKKEVEVHHGVIGALAHLAQADPAKLNPRLGAILQPQLTRTNKQMDEIFWAAWSADLRELQPAIERLATASVDEYEDRQAHSYGGEVEPVTGRFHFARKIASLWNESDPLVRARLLVAFLTMEAHEFVGDEPQPERVARMQTELARTAERLSPEARQELDALVRRIASDPPRSDDGYLWEPEIYAKLVAFARDALRL